MSLFYAHPTLPFACGLHPTHGKREDYPLLNAKVHYDVSDVQMLANLVQAYTSNASAEAEIRYVFPLPPDASVCSFKAIIDGKRTIKGVVKEKAKAKAEYEQAVSQGKTAALLQQQNSEIFQVSLGNIRPKETIEIRISFVCVIAHDGSLDSLRLNFPSAIAPRYGAPPSGTFSSSGWRSSQASKDALDFSVAIEMASQIKSITSPSHPIAMKLGESTLGPSAEFDPRKARVSLSSPALLDKDIVIVLSCQDLDKPRCIVESFSSEEGGQEYTDAYALTLVPRFELPSLPSQEYIFVVDRSGSMGGGKMDAVRSALQILLMSLPARGTSFNIISFGNQHTSLWPSSVRYSADSVKAASAHVDSMTANYGGTEIRGAIEAAFASRSVNPVDQHTPASVFVLTDGQAYDLDGVQSTIKQAVAKAKANNVLLRVFCMGIGDAVSKGMCDTIARAGQGTAAFVGEEEKPDQKLMGLLRAARGAVVEDISIDWGVDEDDTTDFEMISSRDGSPEPLKDITPISLFDESHTAPSERLDLGPQAASVTLPPPPRIQQAPAIKSLPPLYPGFRTSLFAIVRRSEGGNTAPSKLVRVKGSVLSRPVVLEVPVMLISKPKASTNEESEPIKLLHVIAARALIQSFEDKARTFSSDMDNAEVLRVAERYGLASSQTSFVAIDEEGVPVDFVRNIVQTATATAGGRMQVAASMSVPMSRDRASAPPPPVRTSASVASAAPPALSAQMNQQIGQSSFGSFGQQSNLFANSGSAQSMAYSSFGSPQSTSFGSQPAPPGGNGGLFGGSTTFGSPQSTSFGSQPAPPGGNGGLFGGSTTFGSPQSTSFGSQPALPGGNGGLFGGSTTFGSHQSASFGYPPASLGGGGLTQSTGSVSSPPSGSSAGLFGGSSVPIFGGPSAGLFGGSGTAPTAPSMAYSPQPRGSSAFGSPHLDVMVESRPVAMFAGWPLPPTIESFARAQSFDGSFVGSPALFRLLVQQPQTPTMPAALKTGDALGETLWCTLLCVAYLESKFLDEKDVWGMIVEKAMSWAEEAWVSIAGAENAGVLRKGLKEEAKKYMV